MARKMEEKEEIMLDDIDVLEYKEVKSQIEPEKEEVYTLPKKEQSEKELINCLRNERIIVRHVPKQSGIVTNPKHVLYGGLAETATRTFVVPRLSSGLFVNVLTDSEKDYLEHIMGLEPNALSIYKKVDNFWSDANEKGIAKVRLTKQDNYLNLSIPEDYIRYKILLTNKDYVAPSLKVLQDSPKATYQFVIINENDDNKMSASRMTVTMQCYKEFGKYETDRDTLKFVIETIDGRPLAKNTKLEFLQGKINDLIIANSKLVLKTFTDEQLSTKVLIKKAIEEGLIANRGNHLYLRDGNIPLCGYNEEPTLSNAAKYLSAPKNQDLLFSLQAKLK